MRKRLTSTLEKIKTAAAAGQRRQITDDFKYNKAKLKHLKHILHKVTVSLGTMMSAHNEFSKVKGPEISPDGLLGGVGYIIPIKEIKEKLNTSIRDLSDIADCIADELTNPKWETESDKEVQKLIKEKKEVEEQVEEKVPEEGEDEVNPEDVATGDKFKKEQIPEKHKVILEQAVKASLVKIAKKK